ncbi:MAG: chloride channel protein, partial [Candidatus Thorarchaeota archaeon]|nr:chloride channel protein [Candidatus Thorarchaeota archaeon]
MNARHKSRSEREPIRPLRELFHTSHFYEFYRLYIPAAILIGVICGLFMVAFNLMIMGSIALFSVLPPFVSPLMGGAFSGALIYFGFREIDGSGISKAIEMTHSPADLKDRTAITKMVATSVSIGTGNPVGREGPAVLIGAALGNFVGRKLGFKDPAHLRVFLMMGSAGCTAGIYKAPLGGALFATEAPYKRDARLGYFVPAVVSSITAYLVYTWILGLEPFLQIETSLAFELSLVPLIVVLGVCAGLTSVLFAVTLMSTRNVFRAHLPDSLDPVVGSGLACIVILLTGLLLDSSLTVAGLGDHVIMTVVSSPVPITALLVLMFGKLFSSSFVVGGRVSGGVLAPSLF